MSADWERIEALFYEALDLGAAERASFLDRVCPRGDRLRAEVDSLLEAEGSTLLRIDGPPANLAADLLDRHAGFSPGQTIGRYEIRRLVAMGGMGELYLAQDSVADRPAALKILRRHLTSNETAVYRFETEARAVSALRHPNIVTIFEFGTSEDGLFLAMEWVEGVTWRELMRSGRRSIAEAVDWIAQASRGVAQAHLLGVVHRDIKPENLMLGGDGVVKILDFGLARLADPQRRAPVITDVSSTGSSGTISGTLSGTLLYMSPEVLRGETAEAASDIFSLGAVFYELLAGVHPFAGETPLDVFEAIECREVAPPGSIRADIPRGLDALLLAMLDRDSSHRPSAAEVAARIKKSSETA